MPSMIRGENARFQCCNDFLPNTKFLIKLGFFFWQLDFKIPVAITACSTMEHFLSQASNVKYDQFVQTLMNRSLFNPCFDALSSYSLRNFSCLYHN